MVFVDPNDPESVERASELTRMHASEFASAIRCTIYGSWLQLKDIDAVDSKYRGYVDRALREFRSDPEAYMFSLDMDRQVWDEQTIADDGEQQIRISVFIHWMGLVPQRRNHNTLNVEFRKIVDDALNALREDPDMFESEFHWTSK